MNNHENSITQFLKMESAGGIILMLAATLAIVCANSPLEPYYQLILDTPVEVRIGALGVDKPLILWINDGLMALFFFLVGLELKRELIEGELSEPKKIILPAVGAVGGMAVPAAIYLLVIDSNNQNAISGWAIPAATDIAFALGILALLGSKVPSSLRIFLTSLAIFDDIGAIIIIAIFYTAKISMISLCVVAACFPILFYLNRRQVESKSIYMFIGIIMWVAMLKSGVHATLAGVLLAFFVPMRSRHDPNVSPLKILEHDLHTTVAFIVLPVFAFTNAGITLVGISLSQAFHSVPIGIALGLFVGKQIGVFGLCWLFIKLKLAEMPRNMDWGSLYGVAILCGVGFTMSLFIGSLAFEESGLDTTFDERLGIITGSLASGICGYFFLRWQLNRKDKQSA
ncbi:MAG: Na+/H+ antiporter NhaA [Pseudomonadales bacterium]|nr:Na+/H+ antiporter NhaA [Pseudomonadales bacterium]